MCIERFALLRQKVSPILVLGENALCREEAFHHLGSLFVVIFAIQVQAQQLQRGDQAVAPVLRIRKHLIGKGTPTSIL